MEMDKIWKGREEKKQHCKQIFSIRTFVKVGLRMGSWPDHGGELRWLWLRFCFVLLGAGAGQGRVCYGEREWTDGWYHGSRATPGSGCNSKGWGGDPAWSLYSVTW